MFNFLQKWKRGGSAADCDHSATPSPDEDMAIAERVLAEGDLKHAAYHVGCALLADPGRADRLALLDRICDIAPDPLALAPVEKNNWVGTMAVRAHILARLNRSDDALSLVFQVAQAKPDAGFVAWAIKWLGEPGFTAQATLEPFMGYLTALYRAHDEGEATGAPPPPDVARLPQLVAAALALPHAQKADTDHNPFSFLAAGVLRRSGFVAEAIALAEETFRVRPDYYSAVAVGAAHKNTGNRPRAREAYRAAFDLAPDDDTRDSVRLDIADLAWDDNDLEEAAREYGAVCATQPNHPWAAPSLAGVRFAQTQNEDDWNRLIQMADAGQGEIADRARAVLGGFAPYFGMYLPSPSEALINVGRQMVERFEKDGVQGEGEGEISVTLSALEAPSAVWSLRREFARLRPGVALALNVESVGTPDPRLPRTPGVAPVLWRYEGTDPFPAVAAPSGAVVAQAVATLAASPYRLEAWTEQARAVARDLEMSVGFATMENDLFALLLHPPEQSQNSSDRAPLRAWDWTYRVQFAVALLLAHADTDAVPWPASRRRVHLLALVNGVTDWTVDAGVVALALVAQTDPAAEVEATTLFRERWRHAPREGYVCWRAPLIAAALRLPNLPPAARREWLAHQSALEEE